MTTCGGVGVQRFSATVEAAPRSQMRSNGKLNRGASGRGTTLGGLAPQVCRRAMSTRTRVRHSASRRQTWASRSESFAQRMATPAVWRWALSQAGPHSRTSRFRNDLVRVLTAAIPATISNSPAQIQRSTSNPPGDRSREIPAFAEPSTAAPRYQEQRLIDRWRLRRNQR